MTNRFKNYTEGMLKIALEQNNKLTKQYLQWVRMMKKENQYIKQELVKRRRERK